MRTIASPLYQSYNQFLRYHWIRRYGERSLPYQDYRIQDNNKDLDTEQTSRKNKDNKGSDQRKNQGSDQHKDRGKNQHQDKDKVSGKDQDQVVHVVLEVRAIDPSKTNEHSRARHIANHRALQHTLEVRPLLCLVLDQALTLRWHSPILCQL